MSFHKKKGLGKPQRPLSDFVPQETTVESTSIIRTPELLDTLRGICAHRTIRQIAQARRIDDSAVYKQRYWLRKNGYLDDHNHPTSSGLECASGGLRTLQNLTRLHDLRFRVEILRHKDRRFSAHRRQYLEMENIPYRTHHRKNWEGYFFALDGWRVEVTPRSFLLLAPDVLTRDAQEELINLYGDVKKLVRKLEARFPVVCLEKGERLNVVVEGSHAALVNNALAKKYNREKRVFELRDEQGNLRLLIDNSLRLQELEAVSPVWAVDDESKVKRLLHEAVVQDISLAQMREELRQVRQVLAAQVDVQRLQVQAGLLTAKGVKDLRGYMEGGTG